MLVFDCETDGLLKELTKVHCLVVRNTETMAIWRYRGERIHDGLKKLQSATEDHRKIVGHNVIGFDIPALQKVYPWFKPVMANVLDTMVLASLIWPDTKDGDHRMVQKGKMPGSLMGSHSLEAWGHRVGTFKGEYRGDPAIADEKERYSRRWESWNQPMEDYCLQDVITTEAVLERCLKRIEERGFSVESITLEHEVKAIVARQERRGFTFNVDKANALVATLLKEKVELEGRLVKQFGWFYTPAGEREVKRSAKYQCEELGMVGFDKKGKPRYRTMDFAAGDRYTKVNLNQFNPGSRDHVANRLSFLYGWEPVEFTDAGKPKVDEKVLAGLHYEGIGDLQRLFMVNKRLGQISEGKEAWLKHVKGDGRIYGRVSTNRAVTGRMGHSGPNIGQVPAVYSPYGKECRELFEATGSWVLVGADADALELRDLAGYMAAYDGGSYVKTILEGRKEDGTDMHSVNCRALGMEPKQKYFGDETGRDIAKTWFYAFIYGAGDEKLGSILTHKNGKAARIAGAKSKANIAKNLPALGKLIKAVQLAVKKRGRLKGLDGRILGIRHQHAALNTLLQSAGAIQMKRALVILDNDLQAMGLVPGVDYEFVANVHDEWQIECKSELGETIGKAATQAIKKAGEYYNFRCPLAGDFKVGRNWAETH